MEHLAHKKPWLTWGMIIIGTGLLALSIKCIFDMSGLVTGGFSGLAIIIKEITSPLFEGGVPLWFTNLALNIPVFIISWRVNGKAFIGKTIIATVMLSVWLYIIPEWNLVGEDFILAAIYGGAIAGVGMGLIFSGRATTGGTDMVAAIIRHKLRHYSIAQIMLVLDALIVCCGAFFFGIQNTMYAIVAIFIITKASDTIVEGFNFSKSVFIISEKSHEVAEMIMTQIDRGVTGLKAKGMYSGNEKCMLYCVVAKKQIVELKEGVYNIDPNAFVIVNDAREVLGEGFVEYHK